ncbi:MAG: restriction endonuclease subunit M [Halomonadaceae bacterium]|nr:restriction endonuclease subunit M [Halomonadaceae bacterium]
MSQWKTLKLPECLDKAPKATKIPKKEFLAHGKYPIISQEKGLVNGHWNDSGDVVHVDRPLVVFGDHTTILKRVDFDFVVGADGVKILKPKPFINADYLYYYLLSKPLIGLGYARHYRKLKEIDIAFPSLQEQKRIVSILDEAFEGIDTVVSNTEKNLANVRELFEGYLNSLFSRHNKNWSVKMVGDFAAHCLGKMLDKQKNKGVMKPYLRNVNVQWFDVATIDILEMRIEEHEEDRYSVLPGDLLICEGGYPGRAAIWEEDEPVFFQKALHRVRCEDQRYNRWLLYYLYLQDSKGELSQFFTGAGIQHFTGKALKSFPVPLAPPHDLDKLLTGIEGVHEETQRLKAIYQQKLTALADLKQSLLQKAFSGELTAREAEAAVEESTA